MNELRKSFKGKTLTESFKGMTLDPVDAIEGIESLLNAGLYLNNSECHKEFGIQILSFTYDYVAAIKENKWNGN